MRAIVLEVVPTVKDRLESNKADAGYLRCAYEQAMELHARRDVAVQDTNVAIFDAVNNGGGDSLLEALTHYNTRADRAAGARE
jgi:hypothetical protein